MIKLRRTEPKNVMATLASKMATLGGAKGGHLARLGQKNLQKPESAPELPQPHPTLLFSG